MKPTSSLGPELVPPLVVSVVVAVAHSGHKLAALCVGFRTIARQIFFVFCWHQKLMNQLMKRVSLLFEICIQYNIESKINNRINNRKEIKFWDKDEDRILRSPISLKFKLISSTILESVLIKLDISLLLTEHYLLGRRPAMASLFNFFYDQFFVWLHNLSLSSRRIMTLPAATPVI